MNKRELLELKIDVDKWGREQMRMMDRLMDVEREVSRIKERIWVKTPKEKRELEKSGWGGSWLNKLQGVGSPVGQILAMLMEYLGVEVVNEPAKVAIKAKEKSDVQKN